MKYLGGKNRYGSEIAQVVKSKCKFNQTIIEPFCGALWITCHFSLFSVFASDICNPLILLYKAIREGWMPPDYVSEEEYNDLNSQSKEGIENALIGFVGFACSWGGKWFGGYARDNGTRNYCQEAKKSLLSKMKHCRNVQFSTKNYRNLEPRDSVIYADPPYSGTTGYNYEFCSKTFWKIMEKWSQNNVVLVSEYKAPEGWRSIWEAPHFSIKSLGSKFTFEHLFIKDK